MKLKFWQKEIDIRPVKVAVVHMFGTGSTSIALPLGWNPISASKSGVWAWKMIRPVVGEAHGEEHLYIPVMEWSGGGLNIDIEHDDFTTEPSD